jgi:hypothetical protein
MIATVAARVREWALILSAHTRVDPCYVNTRPVGAEALFLCTRPGRASGVWWTTARNS